MTLYNLHGDGPYTISKFTRDGSLESTYELSTDGRTCTCPAGHRHSCRHRDMLGNLRPLANTPWFYDWDRGIAVDFNSVPKSYYDSLATPAMIPAAPPVPEGLRVDGWGDEPIKPEDIGKPIRIITPANSWRRL